MGGVFWRRAPEVKKPFENLNCALDYQRLGEKKKKENPLDWKDWGTRAFLCSGATKKSSLD